jgi:dUTP pyrophosphatase
MNGESSCYLKIYKLDNGKQFPIPSRGTTESSGLDLYAAINQMITLQPMTRILIPNGIIMSIPIGYEAQIRSRSGLALKHGIIALTTGTVDSDYRGELHTLLFNSDQKAFDIMPGMRISQMIITKYEMCNPIEVLEMSALDENDRNNERGSAGWGSTGL